MSQVRAKFVCQAKTPAEDGSHVTYAFSAVYGDGNEENAKFFKFTPSGQLSLGCCNPEVDFEVGAEYYLDFTKAEKVE